MKIRRLHVENFYHFTDFTVDLAPQFNVLVGDNGTGKTATLDALAVGVSTFLAGFDESFTRPIRPSDVRHDVALKEGLAVLGKHYPVRVSCEIAAGERSAHWESSLDNADNGLKQDINGIDAWTKDLRRRAVKNEDVELPVVAYYGTGRLWVQKKNSAFKEAVDERINGYVDCLEPRSDHRLFESWVMTQSLVRRQEGETVPHLEAVLDAAVSCIEDCRRFFYSVRNRGLFIEFSDGRILPFHLLSDGVRNMIAMVADIAWRASILNPHLGSEAPRKSPGIVLIDELDLHLHPLWQRRVIDDLRGTFPEMQFITTTHSPFIIQSLRHGELINLSESRPAEYVGRSIEDIVEETMNVSLPQRSQRHQAMAKAAEEYYHLLQQAPEASPEKLEELKRRLDALIEPFSDNPAYHAFLRMERAAAGLDVPDSGDSDSGDFLDVALEKRVRRHIRFRIPPEDVEDVIQDAWLRITANQDKYDPERGSPWSWAKWHCKSAVKELYDKRRVVENDDGVVLAVEDERRVDEYRELLEVTFAAPSDVHQLIVFAYVQLLEWKPGQVADELAGKTLEDLGNRFVVEYTSQFGPQANAVRDLLRPFIERLRHRRETLAESFKSPDAKKRSEKVSHWRYTVQRRVREDLLFLRFLAEEPSNESANKPLGARRQHLRSLIERILHDRASENVMSTSEHLTLDALAAYFAETLDDEQEERVDLHLADCDRCAALARRVHALSLDVEPALESWTAASHADAVLRSITVEGLQAADVPSDLAERVDRLKERLKSGTLNPIRQASGRLGEAAKEAVSVLLPPPGWEVSARPPVWSIEPVATFKGEDDGPRLQAETGPTLRVLPKGIGIEVRVEGVDENPGLVVLIPAGERGRPVVKALKPARDAERTFFARFEKKDEDFVVVLEATSDD
jgi:predicted ATP-binding protein involved in virulence/DNA-directed RNA polymerase specialized sigma24 family protein